MRARRTIEALLLAAVLVVGGPPPSAATAAQDWEPIPLAGRVLQVLVAADGALVARTPDGLHHSDDGGATWRPVSAPPGVQAVAIDSADPAVLLVSAADGISKRGDAETWTLVLPTEERALNVAISPADRNLVYLALSGRGVSADFRFLRSDDGGLTWQQLEESHDSLCGWSVLILRPHPTDPDQLFRTAGCYAPWDVVSGDALERSADRGLTWDAVLHPAPHFPSRLVGGKGAMPSRYYLAASRGEPGGGWLYRSDDGGATWAEVFGAAAGPSIGGLAHDPAAPDAVYLGLSSGGVKMSADGGASWSDLGRQDLGRVNDLGLGIDGRHLYAATEFGLWRLRLVP
jgi:hypothetical protein